MKIKIFTVMALDPDSAVEDLNQFMASHKIASVEKQFFSNGQTSYWSFVVTYVEDDSVKGLNKRRSAVDYREILSEADFKKYAQLRELRNQLAKSSGKPAYAIFNNEQLAKMVTEKARNEAELLAIDGIGTSRIAQYAPAFVELLETFQQGELP